MRAHRRRARRPDPLATPTGVRLVLQSLRERCPALIPNSEQQLVKLLEAVRHIERRPATETTRGRPPRWERELLLKVAGHLRAVLERETQGRISLQSFTGQYLRLLRFPADVQAALERGDLNLGEAVQLARLTAHRLEVSAQKAAALRAEVLRSHVMLKGTERTMRARIRELLGEVVEVSSETIAEAVQKADELLEVDPSDKHHLFYEEMKRLFYAMREVQPEDVDDESLDEFMKAADGLSNALYAIELKRQKREQKVRKLMV
jgi:hypothetical protein